MPILSKSLSNYYAKKTTKVLKQYTLKFVSLPNKCARMFTKYYVICPRYYCIFLISSLKYVFALVHAGFVNG